MKGRPTTVHAVNMLREITEEEERGGQPAMQGRSAWGVHNAHVQVREFMATLALGGGTRGGRGAQLAMQCHT
jgi:hypothetical protein